MEAMMVTRAVTTLPIIQPLIGFDKEQIIQQSRKIGTFNTSILPYEDCCTVFTPRHPRTKPRLRDVERVESALDTDKLVQEALAGIERIPVGFEG
jgi:thiamine biosynthesis protein ThiI